MSCFDIGIPWKNAIKYKVQTNHSQVPHPLEGVLRHTHCRKQVCKLKNHLPGNTMCLTSAGSQFPSQAWPFCLTLDLNFMISCLVFSSSQAVYESKFLDQAHEFCAASFATVTAVQTVHRWAGCPLEACILKQDHRSRASYTTGLISAAAMIIRGLRQWEPLKFVSGLLTPLWFIFLIQVRLCSSFRRHDLSTMP